MAHDKTIKPEELLLEGLEDLKMQCTGKQVNAFMTCLSELKKWDRTYNLTALKKDEEIIVRHFLDSILFLRVVPDGPLKLADAGTGAGFPGIPIMIMRPDIELTLIEPTGKKASFVRNIIRKLGLNNVYVEEKRIEELGGGREYYFDAIVTRATFSIRRFLENASPYVKESGFMIMSKGPRLNEELKEFNSDDQYREMLKEVHSMKLPVEGAERHLIVLRKG